MSGDFCSSQIWAGDGAASDLWWVGARAAARVTGQGAAPQGTIWFKNDSSAKAEKPDISEY